MAVRSVWKGTLKVGLVMVPCKMIAATEPEDKVKFNNLHDKCKGRVKSKAWCPTCNEEIPSGTSLRGFEIRKGEYVIVEDEELDAIADDASSMLDVSVVSDDETIDPRRIDGTLYLVPAEPGMQQAFETLRQAVGDRLAFGSVTLRKKSCSVALQPSTTESAFIVYKLRSAEQVRSFDDLGLPAVTATPDPAELRMAKQLIDGMEGSFSYEDVEDEYTIRLRQFLAAKDAGKVAVAAPRKSPNVTSLAQALAMSLQAAQQAAPKKSVAKPTMAKMAAPVKKLRKSA